MDAAPASALAVAACVVCGGRTSFRGAELYVASGGAEHGLASRAIRLARSYVIFLRRRAYALVTALWIEDLSGYRPRKTAISTKFPQFRGTVAGSYSNFGLAAGGIVSREWWRYASQHHAGGEAP